VSDQLSNNVLVMIFSP